MLSRKALVLSAKGMPDLEVPILSDAEGVEARVSVWDNKMLATDQGDAAADWINTFLTDVRGHHEFRLVRTKASFRREVSAKYAPNHETGRRCTASPSSSDHDHVRRFPF